MSVSARLERWRMFSHETLDGVYRMMVLYMQSHHYRMAHADPAANEMLALHLNSLIQLPKFILNDQR